MLYLREWRLIAGIPTQQEMAELAAMPQGHISELEAGKIPNPSMATIQRLAAGLNQRLPQAIHSDDLFRLPPAPAPVAELIRG